MRPATRAALLARSDPDVRLWAGVVGPVSADHRKALNTLVKASKACGHWDKTDDIAMLVAENATQALTTLKRRLVMVPTAAPTFTALRGYAFNGTSQFIDTTWVASTMAQAQTLGNVRLGVYERTNVGTNTNAIGVTQTNSLVLRPRSAANVFISQMQIGTATFAETITDSRGLSTSSRSGNGTTVSGWKNGVALTPQTVATPAASLEALSLYIGASNNAGTAASFRAVTIGCAEWGASLAGTATELAWYTGLQAFMTDRGAQV